MRRENPEILAIHSTFVAGFSLDLRRPDKRRGRLRLRKPGQMMRDGVRPHCRRRTIAKQTARIQNRVPGLIRTLMRRKIPDFE
jgi:hypothetical protein